MRGVLLLGLVAAPALAAPDTRAFLRYCEAKVPVATCGCVVNELARTRNGQITLDAFGVTQQPAAQQPAAAVEMANKYSAKGSEITAAISAAEPLFRSAVERCK